MSTEPPAGGPLSDDEIRQLNYLLARYAAHELDQFDHWRIESPYGPVLIAMTRGPIPEWPEEAFQTIWPLPPKQQP